MTNDNNKSRNNPIKDHRKQQGPKYKTMYTLYEHDPHEVLEEGQESIDIAVADSPRREVIYGLKRKLDARPDNRYAYIVGTHKYL